MLILVMVVFLVFLVLGMPIAFCMALSAGAAIVLNPSLPATIVAQKIYTAVDSISFIAIPLFMMAGSLMNSTGITDKIIEFFENLVGPHHRRSGSRSRPDGYAHGRCVRLLRRGRCRDQHHHGSPARKERL